MKNKFSSSVVHEGYLYGLDEIDPRLPRRRDGRAVWKAGRYGYGQLLLTDGHLVVLTERGDVALVRATPDGHEELARFAAISGKTWNTPTIADGRLYVRNTTEMAAFDISLRRGFAPNPTRALAGTPQPRSVPARRALSRALGLRP